MAIEYDMQVEGDMLLVTARGFDESAEEVQRYGMAIVAAALQHGCTRALCIESDLEYRLGTFDIYQAASFISEPAQHVGRAAIVCNERFIEDAHFWETVATNRGVAVRVFKNEDAARRWLEEA